MDFKTIIGVAAIIVGFIGYVPYLRDTFKGTTKPHLFSWVLWGIVETIVFFAQISKGAGSGAWVTGFSALIVFVIAAKAFFNSEKNITKLDWFGFIGALVGIILWQITKNPIATIVILIIVDAMAFIPTYRKGFQFPNEETLAEYSASVLKHILGIIALQSYNLVTYLYPASLALTNGVFVIMIWLRRKRLIPHS